MKYLIDKQAALDALNNSRFPGAPYVDAGISIAIGVICDLPPAQPECQWIPCSDHLPKDEEEVIVSIHDDSGDYAYDYSSFGWYAAAGEFWVVDNEANMSVTAWMPLPQPYKE